MQQYRFLNRFLKRFLKRFPKPRNWRATALMICTLMCMPKAHALEELETLSPLPPLDGPGERAIGWQWHFIDAKGKAGFMEKIGGGSEIATYNRTDGCRWTRSVRGFAPAFSWNNCPSTGSATVTLQEPDIWPLTVGNTFVWQMEGVSNLLNRKWKSQRSCEVLPSVRVKTVSGVYDTHKVFCKERWGTRTWWLSPEVGTAIAYRQSTRRGTIVQEMTHIIP